MSTRTPSLQTRSQYGRDWGNYASLAALPNGSSNALANPHFSRLEVGDVAYITGTTERAVCTSVGTLSGADATWVAIGSGGTTGPLFEFNGVNDSQFDTTPDTVGTPVNPQITVSGGSITMSMDVGSGASSQAIWWVDTTTVPWASIRKIRFVFTPTPGISVTDSYAVGIVAGGDRTLGTTMAYLVNSANQFNIGIGNGSSPGALITNIPITLSSVTTVEINFYASRLDATTFTPNGVPTYTGNAEVCGLTPNAVTKNTIFSISSFGFAGPDWGPAVPEQIGITLQCPSGVVDPVGVSVNIAAFAIYGD